MVKLTPKAPDFAGLLVPGHGPPIGRMIDIPAGPGPHPVEDSDWEAIKGAGLDHWFEAEVDGG